MRRGSRFNGSSVVWLAWLALAPLGCAGRATETGDAMNNGSGVAGTAGSVGQVGTAGTAGNAGQVGTAMPPPTEPLVNRFPCEGPTPSSTATGIEYCGTYTRRTGPVSCQPTCQDVCVPGCLSDSSCAANEGCECGTFPATCEPIGCVSNADCMPGFNCASYAFGCVNAGYACQLPSDECAIAADCSNGRECVYTTAGRKCQAPIGCEI